MANRWAELAPLCVVVNVLNDFIFLKPTSWRLNALQTHIDVTHRALADSFAALALVLALAQTLFVDGFLNDFKPTVFKMGNVNAELKRMQNIANPGHVLGQLPAGTRFAPSVVCVT